MRINARLDHEYELKLNYLQQQTDQSVTEVIKAALDVYDATVSKAKPFNILMNNGLIGCGNAEPDFARHCKDKFTENLDGKYQ